MTSNQFAMSFPALNGEVVMQGHADYCAEHGHATHTVEAEDGTTTIAARCPRCGDLLEAPSNPDQTREAAVRAALEGWKEIASKLDGSTVVDFASKETAAERAALLAPHVSHVEICPNPTWIRFTR